MLMILDLLIMRAVYSPVSYANHLKLGNKLLDIHLIWQRVFVKNPFLNSENKYSNKKAKANVTTSVYSHGFSIN